MKRINKFTAALLALSVLTPTAAGAAQPTGLVHVSQWAYNEVSAFTNADLIPEAMADVTEYHDNATRLQFAELVYSVLNNVRSINAVKPEEFEAEDTDSIAAQTLLEMNIIFGTREYIPDVVTAFNAATGEQTIKYGQKALFSPDDSITRQDAAAILYRALNSYRVNGGQLMFADEEPDIQPFEDDAQIADYARDSVYKLATRRIISGTDENKFLPLDNVTIEQAISLCYRLYTQMTYSPTDGQTVYDSDEAEIQKYENGLTEIKKDNMFYIKNGEETVMEFDADVYTRILSSGNYITAQNFNKRTEVYDINTKEKLFEVPLPVYALKDDYIYTQSQTDIGTLYGLYDYSGNEILPAEYSLAEVNAIKANGMSVPEAEKTPSYGKIYYTEKESGKLYSVDTNGENKTLISAHKTGSGARPMTFYYNGIIYYVDLYAGSDDPNVVVVEDDFYCNDASGKNEQLLMHGSDDVYALTTGDYAVKTVAAKYKYHEPEDNHNSLPAHTETGIYFVVCDMESAVDFGFSHKLYRTEPENGKVNVIEITKELTDKGLYVTQICADGLDTDARTEITLSVYDPSTGRTSGYALVGDKPVLVTGEHDILGIYRAAEDGRVCFAVAKDSDTTDVYTVKTDGTDMRLEEALSSDTSILHESDNEYDFGKLLKEKSVSDDKYTIYTMYDGTARYLYSERNGERRELYRSEGYGPILLYRVNDTLYMYSNPMGFALNPSGMIAAFDLESGEQTKLASGGSVIGAYENENIMVFRDGNGGIWRHIPGSAEAEQTYPNKGILPFGKPVMFDDLVFDGSIYTIYANGNIRKITDEPTNNIYFAVYVPNGEKNGILLGSYDPDK